MSEAEKSIFSRRLADAVERSGELAADIQKQVGKQLSDDLVDANSPPALASLEDQLRDELDDSLSP